MFLGRHWKDDYAGPVCSHAASSAVSLCGLQQVGADACTALLPIERPVQDHPLHGLQCSRKEVKLNLIILMKSHYGKE